MTFIAAAMFEPWRVSGLALGTATVVAVAIATMARSRRLVFAAAAGGLTFQVVHVVEHAAQLGYWFADRGGSPWLTPWAAGAADGIGWWCALAAPSISSRSLGVEMLHLVGNLIFLAGLLAAGRVGVARPVALAWARRVQVFHVAEHVLLTSTFALTGSAWGLSSGFGLLHGSTLTATRVWFHFTINALATGCALWALAGVRRAQPALGEDPGTVDAEPPSVSVDSAWVATPTSMS